MDTFREVKASIKRHIGFYRSIAKDKRTPLISKILLELALGYFFLPFDLIPDFIPVLGQLDDLIIVPGLIYLAIKLIPEDLYQEHKKKAF